MIRSAHHFLCTALLLFSCNMQNKRRVNDGPKGPDPEGKISGPRGDSSNGPTQSIQTQIGHTREMRGVWIPSVLNLNWPSKNNLSVANQKAELINLLDVCQSVGANAVFLQVRPESDALYPSTLEPWSAWLTGTQGRAPSPLYDPLEFAVAEAHRRGLELHAWLNPFRGRYTASSTVAENHVTKRLAQYARPYDGAIIMDPGANAVHDHIIAVFRDLATRYDIDGIHIDDYFYPYPKTGETFADEGLYANYRAAGGTLGKSDWRRDNVNRFMKRSAETLRSVKPNLSFGASPFGIYRPGTPAGTEGALDQFEQTFTDPKLWMEQAWVDYLVPQLYWPTTHTKFGFAKLLDWWVGANPKQLPIFVGINLSELGNSGWNLQEFVAQTQTVRSRSEKMAVGQLFYNAKNFAINRDGVAERFKTDLFARPALPPVHPRWSGPVKFPGTVSIARLKLSWNVPSEKATRGVMIYKKDNKVWQPFLHSTAINGALDVKNGEWAITAIDSWAGESFAQIVSDSP